MRPSATGLTPRIVQKIAFDDFAYNYWLRPSYKERARESEATNVTAREWEGEGGRRVEGRKGRRKIG